MRLPAHASHQRLTFHTEGVLSVRAEYDPALHACTVVVWNTTVLASFYLYSAPLPLPLSSTVAPNQQSDHRVGELSA